MEVVPVLVLKESCPKNVSLLDYSKVSQDKAVNILLVTLVETDPDKDWKMILFESFLEEAKSQLGGQLEAAKEYIVSFNQPNRRPVMNLSMMCLLPSNVDDMTYAQEWRSAIREAFNAVIPVSQYIALYLVASTPIPSGKMYHFTLILSNKE